MTKPIQNHYTLNRNRNLSKESDHLSVGSFSSVILLSDGKSPHLQWTNSRGPAQAGRLEEAVETYGRAFEAHVAEIYLSLENKRSNPIHKHRNLDGEAWLEFAIKIVFGAAAREGIVESVAVMSGESAMREEETEEHEGLLYADMESDGKLIRLLLPNCFNTIRERLREDLLTAVILNNIGGAWLSLGDKEKARAHYSESIEFIPPGTRYPPPFDGLQLCNN